MKHFYHILKKDNKHKFIEGLMNSWDSTLRQYEREWGKGSYLPYVYGERANIGILAIAAAMIKALPFEEYSIKKGRGHQKHTGRADLEILARNKQLWHIEAKRLQKSFRSHDFIDVVREKLNDAANEAESSTEGSNLRMGIVFVIPYGIIEPHTQCKQFVDRISDLKSLKADFSAIHFAKPELYQKAHKDSPGIAIVGRYVFVK